MPVALSILSAGVEVETKPFAPLAFLTVTFIPPEAFVLPSAIIIFTESVDPETLTDEEERTPSGTV